MFLMLYIDYFDHSCCIADNHSDVLLSGVGLEQTGVCCERCYVVIATDVEHVDSLRQQFLSFFIPQFLTYLPLHVLEINCLRIKVYNL